MIPLDSRWAPLALPRLTYRDRFSTYALTKTILIRI